MKHLPTMSKKDDKVHDVSEVLEKFGNYQMLQYFYSCLPAMMVTMININYIFVAGEVNYRCKVPECDAPYASEYNSTWWTSLNKSNADRCFKPLLKSVVDNFTCTNSSFSGDVAQCTEWIYESNNTIVAELDLACQPWKYNLVGTVHNLGMLVSMLVTGWMSDRFGRKPTLIFCGVSSCIGLLKTFATSYYFYVTIEFIESMLCGGIYPATTVLMIEIGGRKNRVLAGVLFAYVIYIAESIFACIAMVIPYWKTMIRVIYSPTILFLSYIYLIRESPRWQLLNDKIEEAKKTLETAAFMNKITIDNQGLKEMGNNELKQKFSLGKYESKEGYKQIFTSREIMKRLCVSSVCRFTVGFVYYGLMINSVWLPGNKYTNFLISTIMSFPGELVALYLMNKVGRKLPLVYGYLTFGVVCIASGFVPTSWAKITLFFISKMIISACFTGIITYTMELYPTSTRGSLLGLGSFMSRMGAMLAPLTPMLTPIHPALPPICFGCTALVSGALLTLTPETKDLPLMDTIQQVGDSVRKDKLTCDNIVTKM